MSDPFYACSGWVSPETLSETEANSRVQLKVEQLLRNVFDAVASVVKLRAGGVSVHPLVVDLGRDACT